MASIFDQILVKGVRAGQIPARTDAARNWFRGIATTTSKAASDPKKILKTSKKSQDVKVGNMYHFFYDAKHKLTLPYYDRFPLIFMVGPAEGGFYGINLHYLPLALRAKLMDALYEVASNRRYDDTTKLRLSYDLLKSASKFKYFKPTFKHYLSSHVRSPFIEIASTDWDTALMLPTQRFEGASTGKVYKDSREKI